MGDKDSKDRFRGDTEELREERRMLKYLQQQELNESNEQAAEKKTPAME